MSKSYRVSVGGTMYGMDQLFSLTIHQPLFDKFGVGNTCSQELKVTFMPGVSPPKMAEIIPYYMDPAEGVNTFTRLGVYYLDVREIDTDGKTTLTAYDSMLKTEQPFLSTGSVGQWPRNMDVVAQQIATAIGAPLDSRTVVNPYPMQYPDDYTMRDVLGYIAAANGGNWIITASNTLLLVPLFSSMPPDTNYLVNQNGYAIVFGGVRILV